MPSAKAAGQQAGTPSLSKEISDERVRGVEPLTSPWKGDVIPLYNTRDIVFNLPFLLAFFNVFC